MFKIDLHIHSTLGGDSAIAPETVVTQARSAGLDGVCITEHHSYDLSRPFDHIRLRENFPIFRGLEYRAAEGHLLIYGVRAGKGEFLPGLPMQTVVDWVNRRGGAAVAAHPYRAGIVGCALGDRLLGLKGLTAVETVNGSLHWDENLRADQAARQMGLKGIGGSDAHGLQALGSAYTCFSRVISSEAELVAALRHDDYIAEQNDRIKERNVAQ
jgi:predicted metal-dependent phosphoesterase TrpH